MTSRDTARAALARLRRGGTQPPLEATPPPALLDLLRDGPAPLAPVAPRERLRIAIVVPSFRRGSGGHSTIATLGRELAARGHELSLWVLDDSGRHAGETPQRTARLFGAFFGESGGSVHGSLAGWDGADVAVATGWQTVPAVLRLPAVGARAYLVQDHEPDFYGASAEREWAAWTYRQGLHAVAASPWLAGLLRERYGCTADAFDLGVDEACYRPAALPRRENLVLFYARPTTPRRAVPLGLLALEELHRRRPEAEIALFGEARPVRTPFPHRHLGLLAPDALAALYATATVGMVLSLTNPSLIPQEMLACGLACVDVAMPGMLATYGREGPVALAEPDPLALCDAIATLLDDAGGRAARARAGAEWVAGRTWAAAAAQVEEGLRAALARPGG